MPGACTSFAAGGWVAGQGMVAEGGPRAECMSKLPGHERHEIANCHHNRACLPSNITVAGRACQQRTCTALAAGGRWSS